MHLLMGQSLFFLFVLIENISVPYNGAVSRIGILRYIYSISLIIFVIFSVFGNIFLLKLILILIVVVVVDVVSLLFQFFCFV
jgi:hypothetical protein